MKYCQHTTLNHPVSICHKAEIEKIEEILKCEGCTTNLFNNEQALNLDKVEIIQCRRANKQQSETMDMSIGISKNQRNCQMLLVEMKFKVKRASNISKTEIENKIKHSKDILSHHYQVYEKKIILFDNNKIREAESVINRYFGRKPKDKQEVIPLSVSQFKNIFF